MPIHAVSLAQPLDPSSASCTCIPIHSRACLSAPFPIFKHPIPAACYPCLAVLLTCMQQHKKYCGDSREEEITWAKGTSREAGGTEQMARSVRQVGVGGQQAHPGQVGAPEATKRRQSAVSAGMRGAGGAPAWSGMELHEWDAPQRVALAESSKSRGAVHARCAGLRKHWRSLAGRAQGRPREDKQRQRPARALGCAALPGA